MSGTPESREADRRYSEMLAGELSLDERYRLHDRLRPVIEKAITEQAPVWDHAFPEGNTGQIVGLPDAAVIAAYAVIDAGWRPA